MTPDLYGVDESAWHALFSQDDACTARKLLATQNDTQAAWIRKMALAADPHPNDVLDVLFTDAPPEAGWLYDLTTSSKKYPTNWRRIMDWVTAREGGERAVEHATTAMRRGIDTCETIISRGFDSQDIGGLFDVAIERWPGLAKDLAEYTSQPALFFELAWRKDREHWLDDSGIDMSWLAGRVMEQKHSLLTSRRKEDDTTFVEWVYQKPRRAEAWARLEAQDKETQVLFEDWKNAWVPEGWAGSPLMRRCSGKGLDLGDPLDHPLFWNVKEADRRIAKRALGEHIFTLVMAQTHHDEETRLRLACGALRDEVKRARNEPKQTPPLRLPPTRLALDLAGQAIWTEDWWRDQKNIPGIQSLLHDKRMFHHLGRCEGTLLAKVILDCPQWRQWRTHENESLLDLWGRVTAKASIRKDVLLRLSKQAPELLLSQGAGDLRMIERLAVPEATRVLAKQVILGQSVTQEPRPAKSPKSTRRSM